jgi:hypothetical protein
MIVDIRPVADLNPTASWIVVLGGSLLNVWMIIVAMARARQRRTLAREAAALLDRKHELHEGEVVLTGVVEHADDHEVAVKVDITQHGTESESSGSWSHKWVEVDRKIHVKPFYLVLADGTKVRVLAPRNVEVADQLDQKVMIRDDHRVLTAELVPGEALHAQGRLERGSILKPGGETGYRDAAYEWQLVPSHGRMLLSSEPLGSGLEARAGFHRRYAIRFACWFVLLQVMFLNFYSRALAPDRVAMLSSKTIEESTDDDGDIVHTTHLIVRIDNENHDFQVDGDDFDRAVVGSDIVVRKGVLFGWDIGNKPTLFFMTFLAGILLGPTLWLVYLVRRKSTRPWFRRRMTSSGSGRLPGD